MDKNAQNTSISPSASPQPSPVKFDNAFTDEVYKYIEIYKKQQKTPSIYGFAQRIDTTEESIWAWANKYKKDEQGNLTDQLARPNFHAAIKKLEELQNTPKEKRLTERQELFCQYYASDREFFANGTQSYIEAYDINTSKPGAYKSAASSAYNLLINTDILNRINELLELGNLNDSFVDKQLEFVITQNADFSSKVAAIREYNKLKTRVIEKIDHSNKGGKFEGIPILNGVTNVPTDNSTQ